jgi:hypothetical protein
MNSEAGTTTKSQIPQFEFWWVIASKENDQKKYSV